MRYIQKSLYIFLAGIFLLISCLQHETLPGDNSQSEKAQIAQAREYFELSISKASTRGVEVQTTEWTPGEIAPCWDEATTKQDNQYEYVFVPIYAQHHYVGLQRTVKDSVKRTYHVRVSQFLGIRKDKNGLHSMIYFTLIPSKGYYTANKNQVESKFLKAESYYGDFNGRIAYQSVHSSKLMGVDKVNKGKLEWGFWRDKTISKKTFKANYRKMFENVSVFRVISTRIIYDGGELEDADVIWCVKCNESVEEGHECPDDNDDGDDNGDGDAGSDDDFDWGESGNGEEEDEDDSGGSWGGIPDWGGGSGSGASSSGSVSSTPTLDKICTPNTVIDKATRLAIEKGINSLKSKYPKATALFNKLLNSGIKITIKLNPNMPKGTISYNFKERTLTFFNTICASSYGALEDWAHVAQFEIYYKGNLPSNRTLEFEAKMFCDLNCAIRGEEACASLEKGLEDSEFLIPFINLKDDVSAFGFFDSSFLDKYYPIGRNWNDSDYQSGSFEDILPLLLLDLMK